VLISFRRNELPFIVVMLDYAGCPVAKFWRVTMSTEDYMGTAAG